MRQPQIPLAMLEGDTLTFSTSLIDVSHEYTHRMIIYQSFNRG